MDPNLNPNGGGMSSVSGKVQRGPVTMANARATYVPGPTTMANARATFVPGPTTMANARATFVPNFKETLDKVVSDYANTATDQLGFVNGMGGQFAQPAPSTGLDQLLGMMYETSGGANYATIRQLEAQRLAAQQNYKTNRADAQNMYGTLSMDAAVPSTGLMGQIQAGGADVQALFDKLLADSEARSEKRTGTMSATLAARQEARKKAMADLGMSEESLLTSKASDEATSKAIGDVLTNATDWESLLGTQKASAAENTQRMLTAAGNTKNQTLLGMKALLDQQQAQINAALAGERSKTPTQKLTSIGRDMQTAMNDQTIKKLQSQFPDIFGAPETKLTQGQQAAQDVMTQLGINAQQYSELLASGTAKAREGRTAELSTPEALVLQSTGLPQWMFGN